jgi:hypothetical protein
MTTRKLNANNKAHLKNLGKVIQSMILEERGYKSLDAFALEYHDLVTKPTLYQICAGQRDMKISTLRGLASALEIKVSELLSKAV